MHSPAMWSEAAAWPWDPISNGWPWGTQAELTRCWTGLDFYYGMGTLGSGLHPKLDEDETGLCPWWDKGR